MPYSTIWGIDIGNSAIKALRMERRRDMPIVTAFDIIDIEYTEDELERAERVDAALAKLVQNHDFRKDPVFLSIAGNLCFFKDFMLPPGVGERLDDLVKLEAQQQIPMELDDVYWGYLDFESDGETGVQLVAVRKEDIDSILVMTDRHKLNVRGIGVAPISLFNLINYEYTPDGACIVLDSGARGTDFVVMSGRQIFFRNIPVAGNEFSKVISQHFSKEFKVAEKLKRNLAKSKQKDKILGALTPTIRSLASDIQRSIGFYKSKNRGAQIQTIYFVGHTFSIPNIQETINRQVRDGEKEPIKDLKKVALGSINTNVFKRELPAMAVTLGLCLQGLGLGELDINLVPAERIEAEKRGAQQVIFGIAASFLLVAAAIYAFVGKSRAAKVQAESVALNTLSADIAKNAAAKKNILLNGVKPDRPLPMNIQKSLNDRLLRVGSDRGRIRTVENAVLNLNIITDPNPDKNYYLTALYISRIPPTAPSDLGGPYTGAPSGVDRERDSMAKNLQSKRFYQSFVDEGGFRRLMPPELQTDLPLICVLSFELYSNNELEFNSKLSSLQRKIKEELISSGLVAEPETGMLIKKDVSIKQGDKDVAVLRALDTYVVGSVISYIPQRIGSSLEPELLNDTRAVIQDDFGVRKGMPPGIKKDLSVTYKKVGRFNLMFRVYERPAIQMPIPAKMPVFFNVDEAIWKEWVALSDKYRVYKYLMTQSAYPSAKPETLNDVSDDIWGECKIYHPASTCYDPEETKAFVDKAKSLLTQFNKAFYGQDIFIENDIPGVRTTVQNREEGWLPVPESESAN